MKKGLLVLILSMFVALAASCGKKDNSLYILNWGDYIDNSLIEKFEQENECKVIYDLADSNETMYTNIVNKKAKYDIVIPSDYMIEKLKSENLLKTIDKSKLSNYKEGMFIDKLEERINSEGKDYKDYFIPYFWGTLGIMYSDKEGVKEAVETNGFKVLFDQSVLPSGTKVGMYDCARDAFAAAQLYKGYSLNTTNDSELDECKNILKAANYAGGYGGDDLKVKVAEGNLDVALVYSGDFFDQRYEYIEEEKEVKFGLYAPTSYNNVFYDGIVIPTTSKNTDLAHKFIDFMLDTDNSFANTDFVGYAPTIEAVLDIFKDYANPESENYDEYYAELMSIEAFNPSLVTRGEVYKFISVDYDSKIEELFLESKNK